MKFHAVTTNNEVSRGEGTWCEYWRHVQRQTVEDLGSSKILSGLDW
jgi:uncharacterized protein YhfF